VIVFKQSERGSRSLDDTALADNDWGATICRLIAEKVARAAGVSRMTVSRALRSDSPVSAETRARILKIVRKLNYVPDQSAGTLSTRRSGFAATLVPSLNNLHFAESVQALNEQLEQIGLQMLLGHTDYVEASGLYRRVF